jgi:hypothetical protein
MRKSPIKVKIKRSHSPLASAGDYIVTQITGAITIWENPTIRVGDVIPEETARKLTNAYLVTVVI